MKAQGTGASVRVEGEVVESPAKGHGHGGLKVKKCVFYAWSVVLYIYMYPPWDLGIFFPT